MDQRKLRKLLEYAVKTKKMCFRFYIFFLFIALMLWLNDYIGWMIASIATAVFYGVAGMANAWLEDSARKKLNKGEWR